MPKADLLNWKGNSKSRSQKQKLQLQLAREAKRLSHPASTSASSRQSQSRDPDYASTALNMVCGLKERCKDYSNRLRNEVKKSRRAQSNLQRVNTELKGKENEIIGFRRATNAQKELASKLHDNIEKEQWRSEHFRKGQHRMYMKVQRAPEQKARAVEAAREEAAEENRRVDMKDGNVIVDFIRNIVQDLAALGVDARKIEGVMKTVFEHAGFEVSGSVSLTSILRIIVEGGVINDQYVVDQLKQSNSTFSSTC